MFALRVPLTCQQGEAGGHGGFEDAEKEANCDSTGKVFHCGEAAEGQTPHNDVEGAVLAQRQTLEETVGRVLPGWVVGQYEYREGI